MNNSSYDRENLAVIVLNYRTPELSIALVENLLVTLANLDFESRIYLVDGNSNDGSVGKFRALLKEKWSDRICFLPLPVNRGYAYGNNAAIKLALNEFGAKYIWILNPDTSPRVGAAKELLGFMTSNGVDIAGSRLEDDDGTAQVSAFNFHSPWGEFIYGFRFSLLFRFFPKRVIPRPVSPQPQAVDWLAGASVIISKEVFDDIGLFDENFFLYFEEVDLMMRAKRAGYQCWYVPESRVVHFVGASTGISDRRKTQPRRPKYWFESRRRFFIKNYGKLGALLADLGFILGYGLWRIRMWVTRREINEPPLFYSDFIVNSTLFKGTGID